MLALYLRLKGDGAQADGWLARSLRLLDDAARRAPSTATRSTSRPPRLLGSDLEAAAALAQRMQDLGRRFGDDTLVALGAVLRGTGPHQAGPGRRGPRAARRGDARRPLRQPEADVDRGDLLRPARRLQRARRPAAGPGVDRGDPPLVRPAAAGVALPGDLPGALGRGPRRPRRVGGGRARGPRRLPSPCSASMSSRSPTAGSSSARCGGTAATSTAPRRPTRRRRRSAATRSRASPSSASRRVGSTWRRRRSRRRSPASAAASRSGPRCCAPRPRSPSSPATSTSPRRRPPRCSRWRPATRAPGCGRRRCGAPAPWRWSGARRVTALASLRAGLIAWQELDAPYEGARTRALVADAYDQLGDHDAADRERAAARACFERLGAATELAHLDQSLAAPSVQDTHGLTARELEVLAAGGRRQEQP